MLHIIKTEKEMIALGESIGKHLHPPVTIELIGDVGSGKTTLTKGIAKSLGVSAPITSPSFTLNKTYQGKGDTILTHYDFYRLADPGIMQEDLAESTSDSSTITVVEWADTVESVLPKNRIIVRIEYNDDGTRAVEVTK